MQINTNLTPLLWTFQGPGVDNLQYVLFPVGQVTQALILITQQYQYQNTSKCYVIKDVNIVHRGVR